MQHCIRQRHQVEIRLQTKISDTELRRRSLEHITRHIPHRYEVIDCARESPEKPKMPYRNLDQGLEIKALVQDSIFQILPEQT